ncbi:arrestin domain-containing protein a-like [Plakobranchus ocellatus]|uniref:Arrestin domain-containing protein a-like n=1 Tax=Plakobranchus ocellatus TaxID=259542 RepID=A0AAV4A3W4_9GAST|nr:arrestin domain-containing protein a-like [Plakobranchus ocellatus]
MMNNQMCLRTNQGEYTPGDVIYGAVYLHIGTPTEATGIKISFKGIERCTYEYECDGKKSLKNETLHVNIHQAELYSQSECFQFGCYVFPFCFELPQDAPGSFQYRGSSDKGSWKLDITYVLLAHAEGSDGIQASQSIVVYQASELALAERSIGCAQDATVEVCRFPLSSKLIHITVKLIDNYVETGTNLQLRLVVTNPTKVKMTGFNVKLLRYFRLFLKDQAVAKSLLDNMEMVEDVCHIAPESGPLEVLSIASSSYSAMAGNAGLDRLQIPLRENLTGQSADLAPSVSSKHVSNRYGLEVSISFSNNHKETLILGVPGVLPRKNREWSKWKPSEWVYNAETKLSSSCFSVPHQLLRTEAFAGLPSFHVL